MTTARTLCSQYSTCQVKVGLRSRHFCSRTGVDHVVVIDGIGGEHHELHRALLNQQSIPFDFALRANIVGGVCETGDRHRW